MFRQIANTMMIFLGGHSLSDAGPPEYLSSAGRILFMGDSITHAGHYIIELEAQFRLRQPGQVPEMINLGLPSETCSGLSEPDHPFPRPDVHERLERALEMTKPDVVVACYGMNDGIYYPFSQDRFAAYQDGVQRLIQKVRAIGAPLILMSPPPFDPEPLRKKGKLRRLGSDNYAWFAIYEGYDDVLERYAAWLMQPQKNVEMVIDLHTPVKEYTTQRQAADPGFSVSPDGVHLNEEGHRVLANTILQAWGMGEPEPVPPRLLKLVAVVRVDRLAPDTVWQARYEQINQFERYLHETGTTLLKFFLHVSKKEQKKRFKERLKYPEKQWKFALHDLVKRQQWDEYHLAFDAMINQCTTDWAPWHVIPADQKWYRNLAVMRTIVGRLRELDPQFPPPEDGLDDVEID